MAVVIDQSPQSHTPSDNPIVWVFRSDQTTQANFYFGVTVYINGGVHSFHEIVPEQGIYGKFDASEIVNALTTHPALFAPIGTIAAGNNVSVHILVQEYYGTPPGPNASATSATIIAFKARLSNNGFVSYTVNDYLPSVGLGRWLTQCPEHLVGVNDTMWLTVITEGGNKVRRATLFDVNGTQIATHTTATVDYSAIPIAQLRVDPLALVAIHGFTTSEINQTHSYTVEFGASPNFVQERIYIDRSCNDTATQIVYFLAHLGSIELFRFTKLRRDNMSVERKEFQRPFGAWDGTAFTFNKTRGESVAYMGTYKTQIRVASDWISEALQKWLVYNLLPSPLTLVGDGTDNLRCKVTDAGSEVHNQKADNPLYQQLVNVELSQTAHSQIL
jgi:hypothetical protein